MPIISVTLPSDDTTADVADYNVPITTILSVLNGGLDGDNIADSAITTPKINNGAVTESKLADTAVTELKMQQKISEFLHDHVSSGLVWSGDAYGSTRVASMTAGVVYIGGLRVAVSAVTSRTFTASRDTYIDVGIDGTVDYNEVTNNNASPALSANHIRIGVIVTGASNIANVGSVNQGQEDKVLPIASSVPYAVTDSLGNLICNRVPFQPIIGMKQILTTFATSSSTDVQVTGLSVPIIVPTGRKVEITFNCRALLTTVSGDAPIITLWDGTVGSGTILMEITENADSASDYVFGAMKVVRTLSAGSHTINLSLRRATSGSVTIQAISADNPAQLVVRLI